MNKFVYRDLAVDISFRLAHPKGYIGEATITGDHYGVERTNDIEAPGVHATPAAAVAAAEAAARTCIDALRLA